jgi:hypothetical protein
MSTVFVVQHIARQDEPDEDVKLIGVYSDRQQANAAANRLKTQPGFRDYPDGFCIEEYQIDEDHWSEGFGFD